MRYFAEPHVWSTYVTKAQACHFCHREGPGYEGPFYGPDIEFVCEECLEAGMLETVDASSCNGDVKTLREQLMAQSLSPPQRKALEAERTRDLECRTPTILSWQDIEWPAHCGDYCRFVKEAGRKDIESLAGSGDPRAYMAAHLEESDRQLTKVDEIWESITPGPLDKPSGWSLCVYLFGCLTCGEYVIRWDCD